MNTQRMAAYVVFGLSITFYALCGLAQQNTTTTTTPSVSTASACLFPCGSEDPHKFVVRSYQGTQRCLDYAETAIPQVFINDCSQSHPIVVEELSDGRHTVMLHAGSKLIGRKISGPTSLAPGVGGTAPPPPSTTEYALTLQAPVSGPLRNTPVGRQITKGQQFALDGDSIILSASMPEPPPQPPTSNTVLVVKVHNARGAIGTPVVLGPRNLSDNEFWDFLPTNGIDHDPTSGFVRVGSSVDLAGALLNATTGTVIKVDPTVSINASPSFLVTAPGVTVRGDRRGSNLGPELVGTDSNAFEVQADYTRITGLRIRGNSTSTEPVNPALTGINITPALLPAGDVTYTNPATPSVSSFVDHNDMSAWPDQAIAVEDVPYSSRIACVTRDSNAPFNAYVARNFLHHNERDSDGYGVLADSKVMIAGNTFLMNRHAIASGGEAHSTYTAWFNLVLSNTPDYGNVFHSKHEQDFDMHGTGSGGYGGIAGDELDIAWNTFLGGNRLTFSLRGYPCARDYFHDNVSEQKFAIGIGSGNDNQDKALFSYYPGVIQQYQGSLPAGFITPYLPGYQQLWEFGDQWGDSPSHYTNPTSNLSVGDFDGDGTSDLFLATGRGWYFSPGGLAEWRFLSPKTEKIGQLLFGDFDGDGRTDVVSIQNGQFMVSWGGISDWELLNPNPPDLYFLPSAVSAMAVGDFDGDGMADIFWADGHTWWVSYGGNTPFVLVATSSFRVKDLRFGDFNADGTTDVFGVGSVNWQVSYSPKGVRGVFSEWQPLRSKLTDTAQNLVVADFNGKGFADVATSSCSLLSCSWSVSYNGTSDWNAYAEPAPLIGTAGIGHFQGNQKDDVLLWNSYGGYAVCDAGGPADVLCIVSGGKGAPVRYSRQEMQ